MLAALKLGNLALSFIMELWMLFALGYWGFHVGGSTFARVGLGLGVPALAILVWAMFMAPHAAVPLSAPVHLALFVVIFGAATLGLIVSGQTIQAAVFAALVILSSVLGYVWHQQG